MKKFLSLFAAILAVLFFACAPVLSESAAPSEAKGTFTYLMVISLDYELPASLKTFGMGNYLVTLDMESREFRFTSLPYNLAVTFPGGTKVVQLQTVCNELGPDGVLEALQQNFGIAVDYWMMLDLSSLASLVNWAGGIEVNVESLSINDKAKDLKYMMREKWEKISETGVQILSGVQMMGYISDTLYDNPTIEEEELRFRERQEVLIRGILHGADSLRFVAEGLLAALSGGMSDHYATSLPSGTLVTIISADFTAWTANEPQFLHIPQTISTVKDSKGWKSLGYTEEDTAAIQAFIAP